jgi:hypothetical protein
VWEKSTPPLVQPHQSLAQIHAGILYFYKQFMKYINSNQGDDTGGMANVEDEPPAESEF